MYPFFLWCPHFHFLMEPLILLLVYWSQSTDLMLSLWASSWLPSHTLFSRGFASLAFFHFSKQGSYLKWVSFFFGDCFIPAGRQPCQVVIPVISCGWLHLLGSKSAPFSSRVTRQGFLIGSKTPYTFFLFKIQQVTLSLLCFFSPWSLDIPWYSLVLESFLVDHHCRCCNSYRVGIRCWCFSADLG